MNRINIRPGDFFCTKNPMALGKVIRTMEKIQSKDGDAEYSHAGIVTDVEGTTLEALWRIRGNSLEAYKGEKVIIGRWEGMTPGAFYKGMEAIKGDIGKIYPLWRLLFFLVPAAPKYLSSGKWPVCSELTCKFLIGAGVPDIGEWKGQNPEDVADIIKKWKGFETVYEGTWPA